MVGGRIGKLLGAVLALGASVAVIVTAVSLVVLTACSSAVGDGKAPAGSKPESGSSVAAQAATKAATRAAAARSAAARAAKKVAPKPNRCARNTDAQRIIVDIRKQRAWMCAHHKLAYSTAVTTGMSGQWTETPTGWYHIQGRDRNTVLTLNTGAQYNVRFWIPFDGPLYGFHDSSWQHFPYGSARYKTDGSHGCVHMPLPAMKFLYRWSARTTAVHIY